MATFARDGFIATNAQTAFTISFSFEANGDINLSSNGTELTQASGAGNYTVSGTTATLGTAATTGDVIRIWRTTSQATRSTVYASPPAPTDTDLNTDSLQAFYMAQEAMDAAGLGSGGVGAGIFQRLSTSYSALSAPAGVAMPVDDTIPQDTEGAEYMSRAITADDVSNVWEIEVLFVGAAAAAGDVVMALFSDTDSTANALCAAMVTVSAADDVFTLRLRHRMTAATLSATAMTVRVGNAAGDISTRNGSAGSRLLGGTPQSYITVTEYRQTP